MPIKPTCEKCNCTFRSFQILDKHKLRKTLCNRVLDCKKCNRIFTKISHLAQHLNRKTPCEPIQGDPTEKPAVNTCIYCRKQMSNKSSLKRHYNSCMVKNGRMDLLFNEVRRMKEEHKKQALEHKKSTEHMEEEIKLLKEGKSINITNNTNNTQNNHFNTTFNFNLVNFGEGQDLMRELLSKEGMRLLEKKFVKDLPRIQQLSDRVVDLIGLVYRNPDHKEMQGIYVIDPSKEKDNSYFHEDGEWKLSDWKPLRQQLLQNLSYQMASTKGAKAKDTENIIKTIYSLGGDGLRLTIDENTTVHEAVEQLLKFDSITS